MPDCFECDQPATTACRCGAPLCARCRARSSAYCPAGPDEPIAAARHAAVVDELEREAVEAGEATRDVVE